MDILQEVKKVFKIEIEQLQIVEENLDDSIVDVINLINACKGKVVLCGMGKPGHIAKKISASMSSMGIPSYVLHPADAQHGDLGMLTKDDVIIFISNSGETKEICQILPTVRLIGLKMVGITSSPESTLGKYVDSLIAIPKVMEAGALGLAPTSSTTAELVIGDAIAVVVSKLRGFRKEEFASYHPAGSLGQKLNTKVSDLMICGDKIPIISEGESLEKAVEVLCETGHGGIMIVDSDMNLKGLITDGDLKRYMRKNIDMYTTKVDDVMTKSPVIVHEDMLAVDALRTMENRVKQLSVLPVLNEHGKVVGLLRTHDVLQRGIFV
jgi:arabinose-5-phosphate isomerase